MQRARATPPPGHDAFFNRRTSCMHGVFDTSFLFFHFRLVVSPNFNNCHPTNQFR